MAKGDHFGGSTAIGLHGSFIGIARGKLKNKMNIDSHLTDKAPRESARALAERPKKNHRRKAKETSKRVIKPQQAKQKTEPLSKNQVIVRKVEKAERRVALKEAEIVTAKKRVQMLETELDNALIELHFAKKLLPITNVEEAVATTQKFDEEL
jgi:hypothetical protein